MTRIKYRIWLLISAPETGHYISQVCVVTTSFRRRKLSGVELSRAERLEHETGLWRSLTCSSLLLKEVRIQPPHTGIHSILIISYSSSTFSLLFSLRIRTALRFMLCRDPNTWNCLYYTCTWEELHLERGWAVLLKQDSAHWCPA